MTDYNLGTARGTIEIAYKGDGAKQAREDINRTGSAAGKAASDTDVYASKAGKAGLVVAAGFGLAVKTAADFEQQMSAVAAVSGATDAEMGKLRDKALQLGKDTAFSASESAAAMEELVKAGLTVEDVLNGAADATVALAAAGGTDMPTAAAIASNALNQFNLEAQDLNKVVDNIAGAANASAIDVNDFGQSLSQVGAVANLAGVDFEDTATAIALLGNAGIKGSDAGTSLKTMLSRLVPSTQTASTEMAELGILTYNLADANKTLQKEGLGTAGSIDEVKAKLGAYVAELGKGAEGTQKNAKAVDELLMKQGGLNNAFFDAEGNTKSLAEVSGVLQKAYKGMTAEQKQASLGVLFGSDAIRSAAVFADKGAKGFNDVATSMGKVSAADVAAKRMDNFKGSLEEMLGTLETVGIQIGTILLPPIRKVVDGIAGLLDAFLELPAPVQNALVTITAMVGAFLLVSAGIIKFVGFIKGLAPILRVAVSAFNVLVVGLKLLRGALLIASAGVRAFTVALLANPIGLIIVAIVALIAAIVLLWKNSETFRNIVIGVWNAIKAAVMAVISWFIANVLPVLAGIFSGVKAVLAGLFAYWAAVWRTFAPLVKAAFGLVLAVVRFVMAVIGLIIRAGLALIKGIFTRTWGAIRAVTSAVWNAISAVIRAVWSRIGGTVTSGLNRVKSLINSVWNTVKSLTTAAWNKVVSVVGDKISSVVDKVKGIAGKVKGALSNAGSILYDAGKAIIEGLIRGITSMISKVTEKLNALTQKIKDAKGPEEVDRVLLTSNGRLIMQSLIDGFVKHEPLVLSELGEFTEAIPNAVYADLSNVSDAISVSAAVPVGSVPAAAAPGQNLNGLRLTGQLQLRDGKAYITGLAQEVVDGEQQMEAVRGRMGSDD